MALRERRMRVNGDDFRKSKENVLYRKSEGTPQGELYYSVAILSSFLHRSDLPFTLNYVFSC